MKKFNVFISVVLVIAALFCTATAVWQIRNLSDKTARQKAELESMKNDIRSIKKKEEIKGKLKLKCSDKALVFDAVNGIKTEDLQKLEIVSPYPVTLYQVIGKEDSKEEKADKKENEKEKEKVLQNSKFESKTFKLEGVTKGVTEIRLFGFDTNGDQVTSQTYQIVFLD